MSTLRQTRIWFLSDRCRDRENLMKGFQIKPQADGGIISSSSSSLSRSPPRRSLKHVPLGTSNPAADRSFFATRTFLYAEPGRCWHALAKAGIDGRPRGVAVGCRYCRGHFLHMQYAVRVWTSKMHT